jgi:hypothetical protein
MKTTAMNASPTAPPLPRPAPPPVPTRAEVPLDGLGIRQLQERYAEVFGEPTRCRHRQHLMKRIVWRLQALREGDLSQRARRRAAELADDADLRLYPPRAEQAPSDIPGDQPGDPVLAIRAPTPRSMPRAGTLLRRTYRGRVIEVKVLGGPRPGFDFEGAVYGSLSAIAKLITGTHCSGVRFFGLAAVPARESDQTAGAAARPDEPAGGVVNA